MEDYGVVEIDYDLFTSVANDYQEICEVLKEAVSDVNSSTECLTDLLSLKFAPYGVVKSISEVEEKTEKLVSTINEGMSYYKLVDEETEIESDYLLSSFSFGVDQIVGQLFTEQEGSDYSGLSYEERAKEFRKIIDESKAHLVELQKEFYEKYGSGIPVDEAFNNFLKLYYVFDLNDIAGTQGISIENGRTYDKNNRLCLSPTEVIPLINFFNESGIINCIHEYADGKTWKESGLRDFYDKYTNYSEEHLDYVENDVLCNLEDELGYSNYFSSSGEKIEYKEDSNTLRKWLKSIDKDVISAYDNLQEKGNDYVRLVNDICTLGSTIYDMEQDEGLMPYKEEAKKPEFISFLNRNTSGLEIKSDRKLYSELENAQIAENLTHEEKALYVYLYRQDPARAEDFILKMEDTVYMRRAYNIASSRVDEWTKGDLNGWDSFAVLLQGEYDGVIDFFDGVMNFFAPDGKRGIHQYEEMYIAQQLAERERYNEGLVGTVSQKALSVSYNIGVSVGNMLIPSAVSLLPIPGARFLSSALFGVSIAGNATEGALQEGYSIGEARGYGLVTGASEAITEWFLGCIPGLSAFKENKNVLTGMLSEGFEEFIQAYADAWFRNLIFNEGNDLMSPELFLEALKEGAYGVGTSGVYQGGAILGNTLISAPINETMGSLFNNISNPKVKNIALVELTYLLNRNGSDKNAVSAVINTFRNTNAPESLNILKGLFKLAIGNKMRFINDNSVCSHFNPDSNFINIDSESFSTPATIFHEISHAIFQNSTLNVTGSFDYSSAEEIFNIAKNESENHNWVGILLNQVLMTDSIKAKIKAEVKDAPASLISKVFKTKIDIIGETYRRLSLYMRNNTIAPLFQDVCDAVFEGKERVVTFFGFGHGEEYYSNIDNRIHEVMANWGSAKARNLTEFFDTVKTAFGQEFYDYMEKRYEQMNQYNDVLGDVTRMDVEELSVTRLADLLKAETKKQKDYFVEHEYDKLNEDAKKRYDLANSLAKRGITYSNILNGNWEEMDFSNMSKDELSLPELVNLLSIQKDLAMFEK